MKHWLSTTVNGVDSNDSNSRVNHRIISVLDILQTRVELEGGWVTMVTDCASHKLDTYNTLYSTWGDTIIKMANLSWVKVTLPGWDYTSMSLRWLAQTHVKFTNICQTPVFSGVDGPSNHVPTHCDSNPVFCSCNLPFHWVGMKERANMNAPQGDIDC